MYYKLCEINITIIILYHNDTRMIFYQIDEEKWPIKHLISQNSGFKITVNFFFVQNSSTISRCLSFVYSTTPTNKKILWLIIINQLYFNRVIVTTILRKKYFVYQSFYCKLIY